jgi:DNA-binding Xre family transcriptional regulator
MKWNLRLACAKRDIWRASELQRALADRGLVISAGKMSALWSGQPVSLRLDDLDVICAVLGCEIGELLTPEPDKVPAAPQPESQVADLRAAGDRSAVVPRRRDGRSLPPA